MQSASVLKGESSTEATEQKGKTRGCRKVNLTGDVQREFPATQSNQSRDRDETEEEKQSGYWGFIYDEEKDDKGIKAALQGYM